MPSRIEQIAILVACLACLAGIVFVALELREGRRR